MLEKSVWDMMLKDFNDRRTVEQKMADLERVQSRIAAEQERVAEIVRRTSPSAYQPENLIPPTLEVAARRLQQSNGKPVEQTCDTIGRIWAWGLLDGQRYPAEQLREAGRAYATLYWWRFGPVCPHTGFYQEMVSNGSIGGVPLWQVEEEPDAKASAEIAERMFRDRDDALSSVGIQERSATQRVTVDDHGDDDPVWLTTLIEGYPVQTVRERQLLAQEQAQFDALESKMAKARRDGRTIKPYKFDLKKARDRRDYRLEALRKRVIELRVSELPAKFLDRMRRGLVALADIDEAEGRHRKKEAA